MKTKIKMNFGAFDIVPCAIAPCIVVIPPKLVIIKKDGTDEGVTWIDPGFPHNNVKAILTETELNIVEEVSNIDTIPSIVPDAYCDCDEPRQIDPVYAEAYLFVGSGIGLDRSKTILCEATEENLGNIMPDGCPVRELDYLIHINRITENHRINRSKNVKSKN